MRTGRYAVYRLQQGEALYSAVVVRFTDRVHAEDVNAKAREIATRSGITDVRSIPIGFPIKIPIADLSPEFRPPDDPERIESENARLEASQFANTVRTADLTGVTVVLDAGHGGRDTGAIVAGMQEAAYVYDIACRVERRLREKTRARVVPTVGRDAPCAVGPFGCRRGVSQRPGPDDAAVSDRRLRGRRQLPLVSGEFRLPPRRKERRAGGPHRLHLAPRRLPSPRGARHDDLRSRARSFSTVRSRRRASRMPPAGSFGSRPAFPSRAANGSPPRASPRIWPTGWWPRSARPACRCTRSSPSAATSFAAGGSGCRRSSDTTGFRPASWSRSATSTTPMTGSSCGRGHTARRSPRPLVDALIDFYGGSARGGRPRTSASGKR